MPQINTKPAPAKKLIPATMPLNISAEEKEELEKGWARQAKEREEAIARENRIPDEASLTLTYQLRKYGRHWNAFYKAPNGRFLPLLPAPSLGSSAMDTIEAKMSEDVAGYL